LRGVSGIGGEEKGMGLGLEAIKEDIEAAIGDYGD
jgi:hypothetical protein